MTTCIATRIGIWSDTKCSYSEHFRTRKLFKIGDSLFGGAGDLENYIRFIRARKTNTEPKFTKDEIDVIELNKEGLFLWGRGLVPIEILDEYYVTGSGSAYALGALDMGATPVEAIKIAAKYDHMTNSDVDCLIK